MKKPYGGTWLTDFSYYFRRLTSPNEAIAVEYNEEEIGFGRSHKKLVSFAAVFRDVTQRSPERNLSVSLNTLESVSTSAVAFLAH